MVYDGRPRWQASFHAASNSHTHPLTLWTRTTHARTNTHSRRLGCLMLLPIYTHAQHTHAQHPRRARAAATQRRQIKPIKQRHRDARIDSIYTRYTECASVCVYARPDIHYTFYIGNDHASYYYISYMQTIYTVHDAVTAVVTGARSNEGGRAQAQVHALETPWCALHIHCAMNFHRGGPLTREIEKTNARLQSAGTLIAGLPQILRS